MAAPQTVGIADLQVIKGAGALGSVGLGSCVSLCALDPEANVGGMVHVLFPKAIDGAETPKPGRFADIAVPALVAALEEHGAKRERTRWAMVGGAKVLGFGSTDGLDLGSRNAESIRKQLDQLGLACIAEDVGGGEGRKVEFALESGVVSVKTVTRGTRELCSLRV